MVPIDRCRPPTRVRLVVVPRAVVAALLALMMATAASTGTAPPRTPDDAAPGVDPFVMTRDERRLIPLDPATLGDRSDGAAIDLGLQDGFRDVAMSGDGSTLVTIAYPRDTGIGAEDVTVVVRDGRTGAERHRFEPPVPVAFPLLSADGTRLVAETNSNAAGGDGFGWQVLDTRDGRLLATVTPEGWAEAVIDAQAERLYHFAAATGRQAADGTAPPQLVAYSLTTGAETGRVTLHGLDTGDGREGHELDEDRPGHHLRSGLAISPNGRQLAIARADRAAITLIDAATLAVERTVPLTRPTTLTDRLRGLLPLVPQPAAAKMSEGITRRATFGADGRLLYIYGSDESVEGSERQWAHGLGLTVVEVATGRIVAAGLAGELVHRVLPAPDGRSVYVVGPADGRELVAWISEPDGYSRSYALRRLDATTTAVLAERRFGDYPRIALRPAAAEPTAG